MKFNSIVGNSQFDLEDNVKEWIKSQKRYNKYLKIHHVSQSTYPIVTGNIILCIFYTNKKPKKRS